MTKLSSESVLSLARLAKLRLETDEVEQFSNELSAILEYVEQLQSVKVNDLNPTYQVTGLFNVMRKDEEQDYGVAPEELLKNVPTVQDNYIKVKRMIE